MTFEELKKEINEKLRKRTLLCNLIGATLVLLSEIGISYCFFSGPFSINKFDYVIVRIVTPTVLNFGSLLTSYFLIKSKRFSEFTQNFLSVLSIYILCSVVSVFHNYYSMLLAAPSVPFFMSAAFGEKKLLNIVSLATIPVAVVSVIVNYNDDGLPVDDFYRFTTVICAVVFYVICYFCARMIVKMQRTQMDYLRFSNQQEREFFDRLQIDPLTGLKNRNGLKEKLDSSVTDYTLGLHSQYLTMIDVDHFKDINDTYGHLNGDVVLKTLSDIIKRHLVENDVCYRFGGEEFLILFEKEPDIKIEEIEKTLLMVLEEFRSVKFDFCQGKPVTFSAGICGCEADIPGDEWIRRADEAMYSSKLAGRNRISVFEKQAKE